VKPCATAQYPATYDWKAAEVPQEADDTTSEADDSTSEAEDIASIEPAQYSEIKTNGKCVYYNGHTDLYAGACRGSDEQKFAINENGEITSKKPKQANTCLTADRMWPKFRPCSGAASQKWSFEADGTIRNGGSNCLVFGWGNFKRLVVKPCATAQYPATYDWKAAEGFQVQPQEPSEIKTRGKCVYYDHWTDLYAGACRGSDEQKFAINENGEITSKKPKQANTCLTADRMWPKFRPCSGDASQKWSFEADGTIRNGDSKCLVFMNGAIKRLVVKPCATAQFPATFDWKAAESFQE